MPVGLWTQVGAMNCVLDGGPDTLREGTLLGIMYLTPLEQWTHPDCASAERNTFCTAGEANSDAALCQHYCSNLSKLLTKLLLTVGKILQCQVSYADGVVLQFSDKLAVKCQS